MRNTAVPVIAQQHEQQQQQQQHTILVAHSSSSSASVLLARCGSTQDCTSQVHPLLHQHTWSLRTKRVLILAVSTCMSGIQC
eukprot:15819-Heterococcus_DN1.PRE.2